MSDDQPSGEFDYGEKLDDGQYENHPTIDDGEFEYPLRFKYEHTDCGGVTSLAKNIAESLARDPDYYSKTFCANCGDYYSLDEFEWVEDGETVGE